MFSTFASFLFYSVLQWNFQFAVSLGLSRWSRSDRIVPSVPAHPKHNSGAAHQNPAATVRFHSYWSRAHASRGSNEIDERVPFSIKGFTVDSEGTHNNLPHRALRNKTELSFSGPSAHHVTLHWQDQPRSVFLLVKPDPEIYREIVESIVYLREKNLTIYVEQTLLNYFAELGAPEHVLTGVAPKPSDMASFAAATTVGSSSTTTTTTATTVKAVDVDNSGKIAVGVVEYGDGDGGNDDMSSELSVVGTDTRTGSGSDNDSESVRGFEASSDIGRQIAKSKEKEDLKEGEEDEMNEVEKEEVSKALRVFTAETETDFIITFGGDGLLLHCSTLFKNRSIPPVMCFDFGSLGFLSPFYFENFHEEVDRVLEGTVMLTLRMRLRCQVYREGEVNGTFCVLNEVVVDRGPSPYLSVLDLSCDAQYLTTVQADGIIIGTPTGSTAYSLAAGGSIVYPSVPAILLTPICAHTLSFRPMLLPDSATLTCQVPKECRASGWVSFDGKHRQELGRGDKLVISMSPYPLPTINRLNFTGDWFDALRAGFMYNLRPRQKA